MSCGPKRGMFFSLCVDAKLYFIYSHSHGELADLLLFITCCGIDGLAHQTDAGVMASQHRNGVVLPTRQVTEITVGISAVALSVVAEAAPGIDSIRCGTTRCVPRDHSDTSLAVHSCCEVGGNTRSWWRER